MICKNCGAALADDALFCITCGQKVENSAEPVAEAPVGAFAPMPVPVAEVYSAPYIPVAPKKRTGLVVLAVILAILFVASAVFNVIQYNSNDELSSSVKTLENEVDDLEDELHRDSTKHKTEIELMEAKNAELESEIAELSELAEFVDTHVVFIEDDNTDWYHKYSCSRFKGDSFWVYNLNAAEYNGYDPCPYCQ